jgi:hypothetical protein
MVSELCKERQLEFRPLRILVDFEVGAIAAFKFSFPTSKVIGCFFHFGQCLFRKIVEVGLKKEYGEDEDLPKKESTIVTSLITIVSTYD